MHTDDDTQNKKLFFRLKYNDHNRMIVLFPKTFRYWRWIYKRTYFANISLHIANKTFTLIFIHASLALCRLVGVILSVRILRTCGGNLSCLRVSYSRWFRSWAVRPPTVRPPVSSQSFHRPDHHILCCLVEIAYALLYLNVFLGIPHSFVPLLCFSLWRVAAHRSIRKPPPAYMGCQNPEKDNTHPDAADFLGWAAWEHRLALSC